MIDTAPLLLRILYTLEDRAKDDEKPEPNVWTALIHRLSKNAKSGNSQWKDVNQAIYSFLTLYPDIVPIPILLKQGLDAGEATIDAGIITQIIYKQLHHQNDMLSFDSAETSELVVYEELAREVASIPQGVFRRSFQICIRSGDTESASSILDSFNSTKDSYPMKVRSEIFGLALLCYTKAGRVEDAKETLFAMIENNMEPRYVLLLQSFYFVEIRCSPWYSRPVRTCTAQFYTILLLTTK
jgi:pentatricopeptide repeat protein